MVAHWGLPARLVSPSFSDLAVGRVSVRSERVIMSRMVLPALFYHPRRAPPWGGCTTSTPSTHAGDLEREWLLPMTRQVKRNWVRDWTR